MIAIDLSKQQALMNAETFDELLNLIQPDLEKQTTHLTDPIPPHFKLAAATTRFLYMIFFKKDHPETTQTSYDLQNKRNISISKDKSEKKIEKVEHVQHFKN